jgi:hypothetical protein
MFNQTLATLHAVPPHIRLHDLTASLHCACHAAKRARLRDALQPGIPIGQAAAPTSPLSFDGRLAPDDGIRGSKTAVQGQAIIG